jgi:hypothetical protein
MINKEVEKYKGNPDLNTTEKLKEIFDNGDIVKLLGLKYADEIKKHAPSIIEVLDRNDPSDAVVSHRYKDQIVRSNLINGGIEKCMMGMIDFFSNEFGMRADEIYVAKNWPSDIPPHEEGWLGAGVHFGGNTWHPDRVHSSTFKIVIYLTDTDESNAALKLLAPYKDWWFNFDSVMEDPIISEIDNNLDADSKNAQVVTISGPAFSSFLFRSGLGHKGDYVRKKPRYIIMLGFGYQPIHESAKLKIIK